VRYLAVTEEELLHLREGLVIIERLNERDSPVLQMYLYGLTNNPSILEAVKNAVSYWADEEIAEQDVTVAEAAVIIPVSSDTLYYLTGSGIMLRNEEVVYSSGGGEGPKSVSLHNQGIKVPASYFSQLALSRDDMWGDDFMKQYGSKAKAAPAPQQVKRNEPAATPPAPVPERKASLNFEEYLERYDSTRTPR
jgi:hypothetical protein